MSDAKVLKAMNILAKWRSIFSGWQLGTRTSDDPECQAVRDHREVTMLLRAEVSGITKILLDKKVCTLEELQGVFTEEALALSKSYEDKFPGCSANEHGIAINPAIARETMKNWRP